MEPYEQLAQLELYVLQLSAPVLPCAPTGIPQPSTPLPRTRGPDQRGQPPPGTSNDAGGKKKATAVTRNHERRSHASRPAGQPPPVRRLRFAQAAKKRGRLGDVTTTDFTATSNRNRRLTTNEINAGTPGREGMAHTPRQTEDPQRITSYRASQNGACPERNKLTLHAGSQHHGRTGNRRQQSTEIKIEQRVTPPTPPKESGPRRNSACRRTQKRAIQGTRSAHTTSGRGRRAVRTARTSLPDKRQITRTRGVVTECTRHASCASQQVHAAGKSQIRRKKGFTVPRAPTAEPSIREHSAKEGTSKEDHVKTKKHSKSKYTYLATPHTNSEPRHQDHTRTAKINHRAQSQVQNNSVESEPDESSKAMGGNPGNGLHTREAQ
ncbi:hypothetical protein KIN20_030789 [Parelaphostrongylus tenuis]|uniref:Uncharacterized protein n=1 Tax=Parelaphostrongylus tenuis TaxID=148309 RepID=A0AAD5WGK7_PARTN|nr:hypothetical protein KIN20_030789 [Parelaphostrongylus tenuis]